MTKISAPLLLLFASFSAHGAEWSGSVTRLALPAHLLTDESRQELSPGRRFAVGDRISTGAGGRVALQLNGGARLTLGEESELLVHSMETQRTDSSPLARLALTRGSVRLESARIGGTSSDVRLNVGSLRLRVLGAELWAATESRGDSVCLLSGAVEIASETGQDRLDQPGDCLFFNAQYRRLLLKPDSPETLARKLASTAFAGDVPVPAELSSRFAPPPAPALTVTTETVTPPAPVVRAEPEPATVPSAPVMLAAAAEIAPPPPAPEPSPAVPDTPKFGPSYAPAGPATLPPVSAPPPAKPVKTAEPAGGWTVIVASLENETTAWQVAQKFVNQADLTVRVLPSSTGRSRVALGRFASVREAQAAQRSHPLLAQRPDTWVLRETP